MILQSYLAGHLKKDVQAHAHEHDVQKEQVTQLGYDIDAMGFDAPVQAQQVSSRLSASFLSPTYQDLSSSFPPFPF